MKSSGSKCQIKKKQKHRGLSEIHIRLKQIQTFVLFTGADSYPRQILGILKS